MAITLFDVSLRPKAPRIEGATEAQRRQGRGLAMIHRMHLREIENVEALIERIEADAREQDDGLDELSAALQNLQIVSNYREFGNLCGRECQLLTFHHTTEDLGIFPELMNRTQGLDRVVERLLEEHVVIHDLIAKVQGQALALISSPNEEDFQQLKATFQTLAEIVRSHFGYEETEIAEALGFYDVAL